MKLENENLNIGDVSRSYLVLYESNQDRISGGIEKFDGEVISSGNFEANKSEDFATMKEWALKNGKKIIIIEAVTPLIRIIPEVTVHKSPVVGRSKQLFCDSYYSNNLSLQKECLNCGKLPTEH